MNSKIKHTVFFITLLLTLAGVGYCAFESYESESKYSHIKAEYAETLTWEGRLLNLTALFLPELEWTPKEIITQNQRQEAKDEHQNAVDFTIYGFIILALGLTLMLIVLRGSPHFHRNITLAILLCSLALLGSGVFSPMMEIEVYEDNLEVEIGLEPFWEMIEGPLQNADESIDGNTLARLSVRDLFGVESLEQSARDYLDEKFPDGIKRFEGRMYFYYQNKSAVGVIGELKKQGNYFVLTALLLFSFIIPFLKLLTSMLLLFSKSLSAKKRLRKTIGYIGKLSMGDVFVIAVYLSYLSFYNMNAGIETSSNTLVGIYFFSGYVLLSIFSYFLVEKHIKINYHE